MTVITVLGWRWWLQYKVDDGDDDDDWYQVDDVW